MMSGQQIWRGEYAVETSAAAEIIWSIFRDVPGWKTWNAGIEHIEMEGPFSAGTWFTMKPPGEDSLRSRLVEVFENECFVDETRVGDLAITVAHRIETLGGGRTRVTYAAEAIGPDAAVIGPAVASDFPQVLASLAKLAEGWST
jgi:hypothetical protein